MQTEQMDGQENTVVLAKKRALEYVEQGKLVQAVNSMMSDLNNDRNLPEGKKSMANTLGTSLLMVPNLSEQAVRDFITGFAE